MDKNKRSTFGANPEHLKRLLTAIGLDESDPGEQGSQTNSSAKNASSFMEQPGTRIGRYKLLRMLGEGGMGIVYLAEQQGSIRRRVALKVIKPGMDSKRVAARFEAERQALALLDHPNIAQVYDAGTTETGRPYFVMEYVKGLPITKYCDQHKLSIEDRLNLFKQVCLAFNHAHQKGIIHRDIKPSNILVTTNEDQAVPKIIDFGVAKAVIQPLTERTLYTEHGQLFGTPEYMSPEQADMSSEDIDTRSDIYSLGVLLYELLTGVLPFDPDTLRTGGIENIRKVIRETNPRTPSKQLTSLGEEAKKVAERRRTEVAVLARCLHKELEWIPLKAMRKERSERYRSASELSDDIENYLKGEPLIAGPPSAVYRARKFMRRHKALVTGVAAVLIVLLAGIFVSLIFAFKARQAEKLEASARIVAQDAQKAERYQREIAEQQAEKYRCSSYFLRINMAEEYYFEDNISRMRELLKACPEDLREWEWYYLWRVSDQSLITLRLEAPINMLLNYTGSVAFSPDNRCIISGTQDGTIKVWDAHNGSELMTFEGHEGPVRSVAFSPDGKQIVSAGGSTIMIWNAVTGELIKTLTAPVISAAFSPDGKRIVSGSGDTTIKVWDVDSGRELMTLEGHEEGVISVAFSPDGSRIVSGSWDKTIKVWDAVIGGEPIMTLKGHGRYATSVAFSPDGSRIVSSGYIDCMIKIWDAESGEELRTIEQVGTQVLSVAFSPDVSQIVSGGGSGDNEIKLWDTETGNEVRTLKGHKGQVFSVAFSPDGKRIVSRSRDNTIKVWDAVTGGEPIMNLRGHEGQILSLAISPDGRWIGSAGYKNNMVKVWDAKSGNVLWTEKKDEGGVTAVTFSPDSRWIVSSDGSDDNNANTIKIWDAESGKLLRTLPAHNGAVTSLEFSPDGRQIISGGWDGTIKIWDAVTGDEPKKILSGSELPVRSVAFSPDGSRIVSAGNDMKLKVWDAVTYEPIMTLIGHEDKVNSAAFSPDGKRIISGSVDHTIKVWDAITGGEPIMTLKGHKLNVFSVAFSPNGKRIISGGGDHTIKVWDAINGGEPIITIMVNKWVRSIAFSPDGKRIVSGCSDGEIKIWDTASPEEVEDELLAEEEGRSWIRRD